MPSPFSYQAAAYAVHLADLGHTYAGQYGDCAQGAGLHAVLLPAAFRGRKHNAGKPCPERGEPVVACPGK